MSTEDSFEHEDSLRGKVHFQRQQLRFYEASKDPRVRDDDDTVLDLPDMASFTPEDKSSLVKIQAGARGLLARKQDDGTASIKSKTSFQVEEEEDVASQSISSSDDPARLTKIQAGAKGLLARKQREESSKDKGTAKRADQHKAAENLSDLATYSSEDTARLVRIQAGARGLLARKEQRRNSAERNRAGAKAEREAIATLQQEAAAQSMALEAAVESLDGTMPLEAWMLDQWYDRDLGKQLVETFHKLGYAEKLVGMCNAYKAPPEKNLDMMKEATGNITKSSDINYIWTSSGRMALLLEKCMGDPTKRPVPNATYDGQLRAWVIDLEIMYEELMIKLHGKLDATEIEEEKEQIKQEIDKFNKQNTCDQGDWANGITVSPTPKFFAVSEWVRKYFPDELSIANKIFFFKQPGIAAPPFVQVKVHRTCFFFKGQDGPGTVMVNPELAKVGTNELRDNLAASVYSSQQFTVEVIDKGKAGKLTMLNERLYVLPMAPRQVNNFDPQSADACSDVRNAYLAFKNSHPDTIYHDTPDPPLQTLKVAFCDAESRSGSYRVVALANALKRLEDLLQKQSELFQARDRISMDIRSRANRLVESWEQLSTLVLPCLQKGDSAAVNLPTADSCADIAAKASEAEIAKIDFGNRAQVLEAISEKADLLQHAPNSLRNDDNFLMEAVKRNPGALKYAEVKSPELERLAARRLRFQRLSGADIDVTISSSGTVRDAIGVIAGYLHCSDASCIKLVLDGRIIGDEDLSSTVEDLCVGSFQMGGVGIAQVIQVARQQTQDSSSRQASILTIDPGGDEAVKHESRRSLFDINSVGMHTASSSRPCPNVGQLHVRGRVLHSRRFEDDYEISTNELGHGVSGSVMQARRRDLQGSDDFYAVKALSLENLSSASRNVLKGEFEVFLSADHPHIVRLLDVYETCSTVHFVMECMKGGELFDRILESPNNSGMLEEDARELVRQMLLAVNYLHVHGIVHRDLKPENFLFDQRGSKHLKMIDFGFSKFVSKDEIMHECLGTWAYCAPEVFTRQYTTQCDLWSIGVSFFVMLFGCMPFDDESGDLYNQLTRGLFSRPPKWYEVSPLAVDFLQKLVTVDPSKRLTAWQALCHPFIYECGRNLHHPGIEVVNAFRKFTSSTKLQKSSLEMMSWSLSGQERARVEEAFLAIDTDMSGTISVSELRDYLISQHYMGEGEFGAVVEALDYNGDGVICYAEFLAAMCSSTIHMHDHNLRDAFKRFDVDGSGCISSGDLLQILGEAFGEAAANELIAEADTDADKEISFAEFEALIKSASSVTPGPFKVTFDVSLDTET